MQRPGHLQDRVRDTRPGIDMTSSVSKHTRPVRTAGTEASARHASRSCAAQAGVHQGRHESPE
jgi:hypothetical protein